MNTPDGEHLLSVAETAAYTGFSRTRIYQLRMTGEAPPAFKIGRLVKFRKADVDAWIEQHRETPQIAGTDMLSAGPAP